MNEKKLLGRAEVVKLPDLSDIGIHARVDTGARKSAIWASRAEVVDGRLEVVFFDSPEAAYTGKVVIFKDFSRIAIATSTGHVDKRFAVKLVIVVAGRKIRATFTLADRSTQVYPILIGRNVLRGKFIVDVQRGHALVSAEKKRIDQLQQEISQGDKI